MGKVNKSRTALTLKNIKISTYWKIASLVLSFVSRTIFIKYLGDYYLGVSGLFSEILTVLSFAELGFGSALTIAMYKPVAEGDDARTLQLLDFYRKIYRIVAAVVLCVGMCLLPFLQYIAKGSENYSIAELRVYYILYLLNTIISYFVAYKYSYPNAKIENYYTVNLDSAASFITVVVQILVILLSKNFLLYLLAYDLCTLISRVCVSYFLDKRYPILKRRSDTKLPLDVKNNIYKEVKALVVHNFSNIAIHSTDNIIISATKTLGVITVGVVSNYMMLMNSVLAFVSIMVSSITAGFGNIVATEGDDKYYKTFKDVDFVAIWIYGFCSIAFFILVPPFITLWIGENHLIDQFSFFLIVLNCYLQGESYVYNNVRVAKGHFDLDKRVALIQAVVNLVVSILFARKLGLTGVYIGTVVSRLYTIIARPVATYGFMFGKSYLEYFIQFIKKTFVVALAGLSTKLTVSLLGFELTYATFLLEVLLVAVIPNVIFGILFYRSDEFKSLKSRIFVLIKGEKLG